MLFYLKNHVFENLGEAGNCLFPVLFADLI